MNNLTESATVSAAEAVLTAAKREADHDRYYGEAWIGLREGPGIRAAHLLERDEYEFWHDNRPVGEEDALRLIVECFEIEVPEETRGLAR